MLLSILHFLIYNSFLIWSLWSNVVCKAWGMFDGKAPFSRHIPANLCCQVTAASERLATRTGQNGMGWWAVVSSSTTCACNILAYRASGLAQEVFHLSSGSSGCSLSCAWPSVPPGFFFSPRAGQGCPHSVVTPFLLAFFPWGKRVNVVLAPFGPPLITFCSDGWLQLCVPETLRITSSYQLDINRWPRRRLYLSPSLSKEFSPYQCKIICVWENEEERCHECLWGKLFLHPGESHWDM